MYEHLIEFFTWSTVQYNAEKAGNGDLNIQINWPPGPLVSYHTLNLDAMCHEISCTEIGFDVS
jgi:hypothetical protein